MIVDDFCYADECGSDVAFMETRSASSLFDNLPATDFLLVNGNGFVFAERGECRLGFFLYSVFHSAKLRKVESKTKEFVLFLPRRSKFDYKSGLHERRG